MNPPYKCNFRAIEMVVKPIAQFLRTKNWQNQWSNLTNFQIKSSSASSYIYIWSMFNLPDFWEYIKKEGGSYTWMIGVGRQAASSTTQLRFTGSKLETATTAPVITPATTPPATMLRRKFFSDGEMPGCAASATSGITRAATIAAAASPPSAFSFSDDDSARTWSWAPGRVPAAAGAGNLSGWKKVSGPAKGRLKPTAGFDMVTAEANAMEERQIGRGKGGVFNWRIRRGERRTIYR